MALYGFNPVTTAIKFTPPSFNPNRQLSEADRNLLPYVQEEEASRDKEKRKIQPLKMIFDILQRGQYVSANVVNEIIQSARNDAPFSEDALNILGAAWRGVTGEQKGSYEDILEDYTEFGRKKVLPGREGKLGGNMTWGDILGFVGDVVLDPTTYIGLGPSNAARAVAGDFAQDVLRVTAAEMGTKIDDLAKLAQKGVDVGKLSTLISTNMDEAVKYAGQFGGDVAREFNRIYKEATRTALRKPAEELRSGLLDRINAVLEPEYEVLRKNAMKGGAKYDEAISIAQQAQRFDPSAMGKLAQEIPEKYGAAGERAFRLFGKETMVGVRDPNLAERGWNMFTDMLRNSRGGKALDNAWFSVMNRTPVGKLARAVGIRNPYEKLIRFEELTKGEEHFASQIGQNIESVLKATSGYDDTIKAKFVELNDLAEELFRKKKTSGITTADLLNRPDLLQKSGISITPEEMSSLVEINKNVRSLLSGWRNEFLEWRKEGIMTKDMKEIVNYLPSWFKDQGFSFKRAAKELSTGAPKEAMRRGYTRAQTSRQQAAMYEWIFGVDAEAAKKMAKKFEPTLDELLMLRAFSQAKMAKRANMIRTFKEFGIPVKNVGGDLGKRLNRPGSKVAALGLTQIQDKAFDGLVFDKEVARVLERATKMVDPNNITSIQQLFHGFTSWWKAMVTMTTGFHARNFFSNNVTGFMIKGPGWFNPKKNSEALAGVVYAMSKSDPKRMLKEIGLDENMYARILNRNVGGKTVREWADIARQSGVISEATHGFDVQSAIQKISQPKRPNLNPLSQEFVGFNASRTVGSYVENTPKFQMFLMDIEEMTKRGVSNADMGGIINRATMETKKWFIDYSDLCFDKETEILTDSGWQSIETIQYDQEALTFNLDKDVLEWKPITYIHKAGYNGPMYYMKSKSFDCAVTPKHKWVKVGGNWGGTHDKPRYMLDETANLYGKNKKIKTSCSNYIEPDQYFSDSFVELVAWVIAEGSYQKGNCVHIYQSITHNPRHCKRIVDIATELAGDSTVSVYDPDRHNGIQTVYIGPPLAGMIRGWAPNKELTMKFVKRLTHKQAKIVMETLINGDGHRKKYVSGGEHMIFSQKNKTTVDSFQALCMIAGRRSRITDRGNIYTVAIRRPEKSTEINQMKQSIKKYSGKIWCIHTDNNTVVARRNGTVYISGNTDFEKNTLKNVIPFYSWLRNNIANQISAILLYPEMYSIFPKLEDAFTYDDPDFDPSIIPDWMKQLGMFPVGKLPEGQYLMFNPNFPYQDWNKIPLTWEEGAIFPRIDWRETKDDVINAIHPMIKTAMSMMTEKGYDFFYRQDLEDTRRAPYVMRLIASNPRVLGMLDGMARLAGREDGIKAKIDDKGKLQIDGKLAKLLEDNLPILRQIDYLFYGVEAAVPGLDEALTALTGAEGDYDGWERFFQVLSYYMGIKIKPLDLEKEKQNIASDIYYGALERQSAARKEQPGYQQRRAVAQAKTNARIRRVVL